jgi:ATP-dependent DNA helicase PIF1
VIFCGDFYQLPPVGNELEPDTMQFCFESDRWDVVFPKENVIELKKIFRQEDEEFQKILNEIRVGELSDESYEKLCTCVGKPIPEEIESIPVKMFPTRVKVDYVNRIMYEKLNHPEYIYDCEIDVNFQTYLDNGNPIENEIINHIHKLPKEIIENEINNLITNSNRVKQLKLKLGTKVMCIHNLDIDNGICNGSMGVIIGFKKSNINGNVDYPLVRYSNGKEILMTPQKFQSTEIPTILCSQIPLIKCWAVTMHKMQGSSIESSEMEIGSSIFEYGQVYVGLSRVKGMKGLYIVEIKREKIKTNEKVKEYYSKIKK